MADRYIYSGAAGTGSGADWTNAHTSMAAAITASTAGDRFFVANDHAFTQGSAMTLTFKGTIVTPDWVFCVQRSGGSVPPVEADLRTTATETVTGNFAMTINGAAYIYGITFSDGSGAVAPTLSIGTASSSQLYFESCKLVLGGTNSQQLIVGHQSAGANCEVTFSNTPIQFGNVSSTLAPRMVNFMWRDTAPAFAGATIPTVLLTAFTTYPSLIVFENNDFSAMGSGKSFIPAGSIAPLFIRRCKLGASATIAATPSTVGIGGTDVRNCDSGDTNYRNERYRYQGTQTTETTIVRTGGGSDGATGLAMKVVTTANPEWHSPFECTPMHIWNEDAGVARTVTVEGIWGGGAVPTNEDIWIEVDYLGTSGFPLGVRASSGKTSKLVAATNLPAGSGTWGGGTTSFALTATFTPYEKGLFIIYVMAAKPSSTFYIDTQPTVT